MPILLLIAALAGPGPGPLDAFEANFAAIHASVRYEFDYAEINPSILGRGRFWEAGPPTRLVRNAVVVRGRWECDGVAERYITEGRPEPRVVHSSKSNELVPADDIATEVLRDGDTVAWHNLGRGRFIDVLLTGHVPNISVGPFKWRFTDEPFPRILKAKGFEPVEGGRRNVSWNGYQVELETYLKPGPAGWTRFEIAYDPSIGYLPRYGRMVSYERQTDMGIVAEVFLAEARPCRAGGFIPVEYYETSYGLPSFAKQYPDLQFETLLTPPRGNLYLGHFRAAEITDREGPVALEELAGVNGLSAAGGFVPLGKDPGPLTMQKIRRLLGPKLTNPAPRPIVAIDQAELRKYQRRPWSISSIAFWASSFVVLVVLTFLGRRHFRGMALLVFLMAAAGCGPRGQSVARLKAAFREPILVSETPKFETTLLVKNEGNVPIRISKVDGGCSCRQVDPTRLPALIRSGATLPLAIRLSGAQDFQPRSVPFAFETDRGSLLAPAELLVLPRHHLNPDSISFQGVTEGRLAGVEVVHRMVYRADGRKPSASLVIPPEVELSRVGSRSGRVGAAPDYAYEDTTYRVELEDRSLGLHRIAIALREGGRNVVEVPVVWQRLPYLTTVPDRVNLGSRPIRVFLRCPDEDVELTHVLKAPTGIKAVVSSPREATVRLADDAPGVIDDILEVGTTAEGQPPLRAPIVRYAPLAQRADSLAGPAGRP